MTRQSDLLKKAIAEWAKTAAQITAATVAVSGAVSAFFSASSASAYASAALCASGAGGYVAVQRIPIKAYERVPHVPPRPPKPQVLERDMHQLLMFKPEKTPPVQYKAKKKGRHAGKEK